MKNPKKLKKPIEVFLATKSMRKPPNEKKYGNYIRNNYKFPTNSLFHISINKECVGLEPFH